VPGQRGARGRIREQPSSADRAAAGKDARQATSLESLAEFHPGRRDPIGLLLGQAKSRVPRLVPIRHGRMMVSPFSYFRGAALPMAADLAAASSAPLRAQLCGDAHLSNFGAFASPERNLVFDVNDFDETLPGPFDWDVKRLAASLVIAGRENGFSAKACRKLALGAANAYRTAMRKFAAEPFLAVWYEYEDVARVMADVKSQLRAKRFKAAQGMVAKAQTHDSTQALRKLTTVVDGQRKIINDPPMIVPVEDIDSDADAEALYDLLSHVLARYRRTLESDRRHLLDQFSLAQCAFKVVGVGSVGTRAWVVLMQGTDGEPLFLQAKEAQQSVLEDFCGRSQYANEGERVVAGQRLIQAQSDIFLGWTHVAAPDGIERDFYVRQLRDWKFSVPIEQMVPAGLTAYGRLCGWTLARGHARSGDSIAIASYLGRSSRFEKAIAAFADSYADQNEADYGAFVAAAKDGRVPYTTDI
jgi:uncharacterized protein (DUF2252 family)